MEEVSATCDNGWALARDYSINTVGGEYSVGRKLTSMSVCAIIIAVLTPIGSYVWLDPQAFRHRPKLNVSLESVGYGSIEEYHNADVRIVITSQSDKTKSLM